MKKNLRIVSAAAAALLAVAPVAASAVSANAAVTVNGNVQSQDTHKASDITVNISLDAKNGTTVEQAKKSIKVTVDGATLTGYKLDNVKIIDATHPDGLGDTDTLKSGEENKYQIEISGITLTNLTTGTPRYTISGGKITGATADANGEYSAEDLKPANGSTLTFKSDSFRVFDTSIHTQPYFVNNNSASQVQIKDNGTVSTTVNKISDSQALNGATLQQILDAAKATVAPRLTGFTHPADSYITDVNDVKKQLQKENVTVNGNNTISIDNDKAFTVSLTIQNVKSGKTATVKVPFKTQANDDVNHPVIYFYEHGNATNDIMNGITVVYTKGTGAKAIQMGSEDWKELNKNYNLSTPEPIIKIKASSNSQFEPTHFFKAAINEKNAGLLSNSNDNTWTNDFTVVDNNVDASKEGVYHVTVSAKNNSGKETKVTVPVVVLGHLNTNVVTIKNTPGYPVTVYNILGGSAVKSANNYDFLYNGYPVKTFETKTVDGKSYTRIQDTEPTHALFNDNNAWVESDKLSNFQESKTSVKIMHSAKVYNEKHEATGKENKHAYNMVEVVADESGQPKEFTIGKDVPAYKLADGSGYIDSRNVTATPKKLNHNSYVYKSNGKVRTYKKTVKKGKKHVKVTRRVLKKKGTTVNTYGAAFNIKGHKMFRIGKNQYIKVANFE